MRYGWRSLYICIECPMAIFLCASTNCGKDLIIEVRVGRARFIGVTTSTISLFLDTFRSGYMVFTLSRHILLSIL